MTTSTHIQETTTDLLKKFRSYHRANPAIDDWQTVINDVLTRFYPDMHHEQVLKEAAENSLTKDRVDEIRNNNETINTHIQNDLFNQYEFEVPKFVIDDDNTIKPYYQCTVEEMLEYYQRRQEALEQEARQHEYHAARCREKATTFKAQADKLRNILEMAQSRGISTECLKFAKTA